MLKVGLTGGIACGKSHTLKQFHKLGALTIDADRIAHSVMQPGEPAYEEIVRLFGSDILAADKTIDRRKLGKLVFSDPDLRSKLNAAVHPYVYEAEREEIDKARQLNSNPMVLVDAALMVETGSYKGYEVVIVVYCRPDIQLNRLMSREGLSEEEALIRIASQMPILEKIRYADYVIENSGKLSDTDQQVKHIFADLLSRFELR